MNDPYQQIIDDLTADLYETLRRHGSRLLREAAKDAADSDLLREALAEATRGGGENAKASANPADAGDEAPPSESDLSAGAQRVLDDLTAELRRRAQETD